MEEEEDETARETKAVKRDRGRMVTPVVRQQNAVESRKGETALYVSIAIPTFLGCPEWRGRRDGAYERLCVLEFYTGARTYVTAASAPVKL